MKKILAALLLVALLCGFTACGTREYTCDIFAMDTVMSITVYGRDAKAQAEAAAGMILRLEDSLSVTKPGSEIAVLNREGSAALSEETGELLLRCLALSEETGGAVSPLLYRLSKLWGFTTGVYRVPSDAEITAALDEIGSVSICGGLAELTDAEIDLGAFAKGYAAQQAADALREAGVNAALLSLGGNVQTVGRKPDGSAWRIGIRDPQIPEKTVGILSLGEGAVVTSGGYQRYFEENGVRYSHILDPTTGKPAQSGLASVTVVAEEGFLADGLSTALYVMGLAEATGYWRGRTDFEAVFVTDDGAVYATAGLADYFECAEFTVIER